MLPVVGMEARWLLVNRGGLARNVSLCYRGLRKLRHDKVSFVPVRGVA